MPTEVVTTYAARMAQSKEVKEAKQVARTIRDAGRSVSQKLIELSDRLENKTDDIEILKNSASFNINEIVKLQMEITDINLAIAAVNNIKKELFPA
jgi:methyl-accepting chemotaxis protein